MLYPEDTKFLIGSIAIGIVGVIALCMLYFFGALSCFVLSIAGISAHFSARRKEKKRKREMEKELEEGGQS